MKIINDQASSKKIIKAVLLSVAVGFAVMLLSLLISAFIMLKADMGDTAANVISTVVLMLSAFVCGFVSSKIMASRVMLIAPFAGFIFYLTVAVIGAAVTKSTFGKLFLLRMLLCIILAALGAFLCAVRKQNKKYI